MNDESPDLRELERHVAQLGERFDSVRIVATSHRDGITQVHSYGAGNFAAQMGATREWLMSRDEELKECVRRRCGDDTA